MNTPHSERMTGLLLKSAEALEDGRDPFSTKFLADNQVTAEECMVLSSTLGTIVYGYLHSSRETQMVILGVGAIAPAMSESSDMANITEHTIRRQFAMKTLKEMRP